MIQWKVSGSSRKDGTYDLLETFNLKSNEEFSCKTQQKIMKRQSSTCLSKRKFPEVSELIVQSVSWRSFFIN